MHHCRRVQCASPAALALLLAAPMNPALAAAGTGVPAGPANPASAAQAGETERAIVADYARADAFLPDNAAALVLDDIAHLTWLSADTLWFVRTTAQGREYVWSDPVRGRQHALFAHQRLAAALALASGTMQHGNDLRLRHLEVSADLRALTFESGGRQWRCDTEGTRCVPIEVRSESRSPDGRQAIFRRDENLWLRPLPGGSPRALTSDGAVDDGYGTDNPGWEHSDRPILTWSPDSRRIATYRQDQRGVADAVLIATERRHPHTERWKYPMAGDATIATIERVVIDVPSGRLVRLDLPPDPHRSSVCYDVQCGDGRFADVQWSPDSSRLAFVSTSRDHKHVILREADATTGRVRTVLTESSPTYYESDLSSMDHGAVNWRYLPDSNALVWYSERSNYAHLYLYDLSNGRRVIRSRAVPGTWSR